MQFANMFFFGELNDDNLAAFVMFGGIHHETFRKKP